MYKIIVIVNTIIRGDNMKKAIGMMALGVGMGAGAVFMYDQISNGNASKAINKGAKEISKAVSKTSKKINDSN
jgi:hypothetical protein